MGLSKALAGTKHGETHLSLATATGGPGTIAMPVPSAGMQAERSESSAQGHAAGKDKARSELVILGQTHRAESCLGKSPHSMVLGKSFGLSEPPGVFLLLFLFLFSSVK